MGLGLKRIHAKGYTDNVVELMVGKLSRLPVDTQQALQQFACMGNSAEFEMLQRVYQSPMEELAPAFVGSGTDGPYSSFR